MDHNRSLSAPSVREKKAVLRGFPPRRGRHFLSLAGASQGQTLSEGGRRFQWVAWSLAINGGIPWWSGNETCFESYLLFKICVLSIGWLISHELAKKKSCGKKYGRVWRERERERGISTPQAVSGIHRLVAILLWRAQGHDMNWQAFWTQNHPNSG